jgi:hypothetical protein
VQCSAVQCSAVTDAWTGGRIVCLDSTQSLTSRVGGGQHLAVNEILYIKLKLKSPGLLILTELPHILLPLSALGNSHFLLPSGADRGSLLSVRKPIDCQETNCRLKAGNKR